jgi:hypothetical protein
MAPLLTFCEKWGIFYLFYFSNRLLKKSFTRPDVPSVGCLLELEYCGIFRCLSS